MGYFALRREHTQLLAQFNALDASRAINNARKALQQKGLDGKPIIQGDDRKALLCLVNPPQRFVHTTTTYVCKRPVLRYDSDGTQRAVSGVSHSHMPGSGKSPIFVTMKETLDCSEADASVTLRYNSASDTEAWVKDREHVRSAAESDCEYLERAIAWLKAVIAECNPMFTDGRLLPYLCPAPSRRAGRPMTDAERKRWDEDQVLLKM